VIARLPAVALSVLIGLYGVAAAQVFSPTVDVKTIQLRRLGAAEGAPAVGTSRKLLPGETFLTMPVGEVQDIELAGPLRFTIDGRPLSLPVGQKFFASTFADNNGGADGVFCMQPSSDLKNRPLDAVLLAISPPKRPILAKLRIFCAIDVDGDGAFDRVDIKPITVGKKTVIPEDIAPVDQPAPYRALPGAALAESSFAIKYGEVLGSPVLTLQFTDKGRPVDYDSAAIVHSGTVTRTLAKLSINRRKLPQSLEIGDGVLTVMGYDPTSRALDIRYDRVVAFNAFRLDKSSVYIFYIAI